MKTISKTTSCEPSSNDSGYTRLRAFTLVELLTLIATALVGAVLLAPALARSQPPSQAAQCLNNMRQLLNAMTMYTLEYNEMFPPNPDDGNTVPGHCWAAGQGGKGGAQEFNPDTLANPSLSQLATYLRSNVSVFACTADLRQGLYQGTGPRKLGTTVRAARCVSMNSAVGNACPTFANSCSGHSGVPSIPVVGTWLTGSHSCSPSAWRTYGKTSDIVDPGPDSLFMLIEENPWTINDGVLAFSAGIPQWVDYPSGLHSFSGVLGFADTHGELHKWVERSTRLNGWSTLRRISPNDRDWLWLKARTAA